MKKRLIRLFAALLLCAMLFPLVSCNSSFGTFMTVTSSLKDKGYKVVRVMPFSLIPANLMEQSKAESNVNIEVENLQWGIIAESDKKQPSLLILIFGDTVSADAFWEQMPAMLSEIFTSHTCVSRTDYATGTTYCPSCAEPPAFEIEESENTIRIIGNNAEDADDVDSQSIVKEGNIIYIEI